MDVAASPLAPPVPRPPPRPPRPRPALVSLASPVDPRLSRSPRHVRGWPRHDSPRLAHAPVCPRPAPSAPICPGVPTQEIFYSSEPCRNLPGYNIIADIGDCEVAVEGWGPNSYDVVNDIWGADGNADWPRGCFIHNGQARPQIHCCGWALCMDEATA